MSSRDAFVEFRWSVGLGWLATVFYAGPGIFFPTAVAEFIGAAPPYDPVWPAFAFLLTCLVMLFSWPVIIDPIRYQFHAVVGILGRFGLFVFWFWLYPHSTHESLAAAVPWVAWLELLIGVVQALLFSFARRDAVIRPSISR